MSEYITAEMFSSMFIAGTRFLEEKKAYINELNVFPVPDGDTGTNMSLTLDSAVTELLRLPSFFSLEEAGRAVSTGALKGARGNSGVIMSQLIRGFSKGTKGCEVLKAADIARAMALADEMARKAVAKPKEGTILTVARAAAGKAAQLCGADISLSDLLKEITDCAEFTLSETPKLLPVLKEAGVVDSGGQGLLEFYRGALAAFTGQVPKYRADEQKIPKVTFPGHVNVDSSDIETSDIKFTYCTEFIVDLNEELSLEKKVSFKKYLEELGDSLVFVCTEDMVKIHVHTNHPGLAFEKGLEFGSLTGMKIDNMKEEHKEKLEIEESLRLPLKEYDFVSVCSGDGIKEIFKNMSAGAVVDGGQTMNPSAEDIADAIRSTRAKSVYVLPNNKNVILTAEQAGQLCEDIDVYVIPTTNIAEGISAVINYVPALSASENAEHMKEQLKYIKTAEITYAIRDSEIEGVKINKGDHMALSGGHVVADEKELADCAARAIEVVTDEDTEIITIYYGKDVSEETAKAAAEHAEKICPDADTEIVNGGQEVYAFIISAE